MRYLRMIKEKYPETRMPSQLFLNNLHSFYLSLFWEVIDRRLSKDEMESYADETTTFIWSGLQALLLHRFPWDYSFEAFTGTESLNHGLDTFKYKPVKEPVHTDS